MEGLSGSKDEGVGCGKRRCAGQEKMERHSSHRTLWRGKRLMAKKKKRVITWLSSYIPPRSFDMLYCSAALSISEQISHDNFPLYVTIQRKCSEFRQYVPFHKQCDR